MYTKRSLLLLNIGTPQSCHWLEVARYLGRFLNDWRLLPLKPWLRWLLVYMLIIPLRTAKVVRAYQRIWLPQGSPLKVHNQNLVEAISHALEHQGYQVALADNTTPHSMANALKQLIHNQTQQLTIMPLFPQYASATTGSLLEAVLKQLSQFETIPPVQIIRPFYNHPKYIKILTQKMDHTIKQLGHFDKILFSYHGLPVNQIKNSDLSGHDCQLNDECCHAENHPTFCYRAHCLYLARNIAERLNLTTDQWEISFQSRLGRGEWLTPYTIERLRKLPQEGVKNLIVCTPSFVCDCLETLDELGHEGKAIFQQAGGQQWTLVPCLNDDPQWIDALKSIILEHH